jgi:hypothetical protein
VFTRELMSLGDNEKRKPRSHIWDGLHPKYQKFGIILLSGTSLQPVETAGADAKVLAMAGGEPIDIKKFDGRNKPKAAPDTEPVELPELPAQFAGIAEQLRELLPARRYDEAAGVLEKALADPDLKQVSELIRGAQEDVRLLRGFWTLAADKMAGLKPGDSVLVGGMRGDLVEYRDGQVIATVGTVNRRTAFHDLRPRDLVFLFTDSNEPTDPDLLKKIWLFMATDRQGQPADVDHWRGLATRAGAELTGRGVYLIPKGKAR